MSAWWAANGKLFAYTMGSALGTILAFALWERGRRASAALQKISDNRRRLVLIALAVGPGYGLQVQERIRRFGIRAGHWVYPMLRQLEEEGRLESWTEPGPPARGGRPQRYYRRTDRRGSPC